MDIDYKVRTRTSRRQEFVIDLEEPVDAKNFEWALHRFRQAHLPENRQVYDDAYFVEIRGTELVFWYTTEEFES